MSPAPKINELLLYIDASVAFKDFIRFKKDNLYIDKAMLKLSTKIMRDNIVNNSKGKYILSTMM